jgi:hypothetical protein
MNYEFVFIVLILLIASIIQGFSGFGLAIISIPLLSLFMNIKSVIPLIALCGLLLNILLFIELRENIVFNDLKPLYFGSIFGIPIGIIFFKYADVNLLKTIVGLIILIFVFISFLKNIHLKNIKPIYGYLAGLFSGFLGGAINTNGPPVLIYQKITQKSKTAFKSAITGYFIVNSFIIVSIHLLTGITNEFVLKHFVYLFPVVILGYYLGHKTFKKINTTIFNKIVLFLLLVIASLLLINI